MRASVGFIGLAESDDEAGDTQKPRIVGGLTSYRSYTLGGFVLRKLKRWLTAFLRLFVSAPAPALPTVPLQSKNGTISIAPLDQRGEVLSARNARRLDRKASRKRTRR